MAGPSLTLPPPAPLHLGSLSGGSPAAPPGGMPPPVQQQQGMHAQQQPWPLAQPHFPTSGLPAAMPPHQQQPGSWQQVPAAGSGGMGTPGPSAAPGSALLASGGDRGLSGLVGQLPSPASAAGGMPLQGAVPSLLQAARTGMQAPSAPEAALAKPHVSSLGAQQAGAGAAADVGAAPIFAPITGVQETAVDRMEQAAQGAASEAGQGAPTAALNAQQSIPHAQPAGAAESPASAMQAPTQPSPAPAEPALQPAAAPPAEPGTQEPQQADRQPPEQSALAARVSEQLLGSQAEPAQAPAPKAASCGEADAAVEAAAEEGGAPQQQSTLAAQVDQVLLGAGSEQADEPAAERPVPAAAADKLLAIAESPNAAAAPAEAEGVVPAVQAVPAAEADKLLAVPEVADTAACIPSTANAPPADPVANIGPAVALAPVPAPLPPLPGTVQPAVEQPPSPAAAAQLPRQRSSPRLIDPTMHLGSNGLPAANGGAAHSHPSATAAATNGDAAAAKQSTSPKLVDPLQTAASALSAPDAQPVLPTTQDPGSPAREGDEADLWGSLLVDSPSPCKVMPAWGSKPANA